MTPEQAWQAALGQLQMEMPKATFDTWVRDTRLIAFTDDNGRHDDKPVVFTLGFVNAYARDWVESRLESTLRRILVGVLGQEVKLQFEIHYDKPERFEPETSLDHQREIETDPDGDETLSTEDARFAILRTSLEEAILQPERIVAVPGYFLRWLPYLGPGRGWVVVALRQAFYETYGKTAFANAPFEASGEQVARWAGTTRRTFQNYIAALEADPLAWFVSRGESGEGQANTYRFRLAMPLTPGDADRLRNWLIVNGVKTDPESALQRALELQPKQILPYPAQVPTRAQLKRKPNPRTVQQVILETCKIQPDSEPYQAVAKLAKKLENRLLPQKDQLIISHYFLLHWLPLLGPGPAWMITLLRDQCYHNRETGELRDTITLKDGYRELANALGIERPKTIGDWLPPLDEMARRRSQEEASTHWQKRQEKRDFVALFLEKTEHHFRPGRFGKTAQWTLKVSQGDSLIPAHALAVEPLTRLIHLAHDEDEVWVAKLLEGEWDNEFEARISRGWGANFTGSDEFEARNSQVWGANFTGSGEFEARNSQDLRREFHTLKLLIKHFNLKHLIKHLPPLTPPAAVADLEPEQGVVGVEFPKQWNFEKLLEMGSVPKAVAQKTLERIAQNPVIGTRFLAWVMYGYVHKGLPNEKGIHTPILFANSRAGAPPSDPDYLELAKCTPRELARLRHAWQRFSVPGMSRSQSEKLYALEENGFFTLLEYLTEEKGEGG